ncbi:MAG: glycosyltransferase [Prevotella sp.]|nr:glycosyltransferase [Candidatus Prevotella equi]
MNVLLLSTYQTTGGAAIACNRLMHALRKNGVQANMLCRHDIPWWPKRMKPQSYTSLWERLVIWLRNGLNHKTMWAYDTASCGQDVTKTKAFREADVIHLHWINQGFLSLRTIEKILRSGKRVVWTMHDEWPLEAVEHYTDPAATPDKRWQDVLQKKQRLYSLGHITFVTCSQWLRDISLQKPLAQGQEVISIPNPIDTTLFAPVSDKTMARQRFGLPSDKKVVLFVCQSVTDKRKGLDYLIAAAEQLGDVAIALVGNNTDVVAHNMPRNVTTYPLGSIRDVSLMAQLYAACDCFVTPSLHDNLPNTIMEAMSCGTPCVGFHVGGIPEMIDHQVNGYVAQYKDAADLAQGIRYVLSTDNHHRLSLAARSKVEQCYSESAVAEQYITVYNRPTPSLPVREGEGVAKYHR